MKSIKPSCLLPVNSQRLQETKRKCACEGGARRMAEWEARNPPFPNRHSDSTTVNRCLPFVWNPWTSWEVPAPWVSIKPVNETARKIWDTLVIIPTLGRAPSFLEGRKSCIIHPKFQLFQGLPRGLVCFLSQKADGTWHTLDAWRPRE